MITSRTFLLIVLSSSLSACALNPNPGPMPGDPGFAPVLVSALPPALEPTGSIYQRGNAVDLYQRRAHRMGDVLTINLNEATSATKTSDTSFTRDSSTSIPGVTSLFGNSFNGRTELGSVTDFDGEAESEQSNQLIGNITVTVADVLPNGLLVVRGEKWLQLNKGSEYIRISGLVRREDINPDNTISSTRVADVRIAYSGTGTLADSNEPGWLTRFFTGYLWPL
ncbi:MAG: flagellar basal body L-ring protein FlgH [Pseudomonadales bacterium]|nr:flagellar basal body L-ring protein FlgH [Pseudomonadales bacterium]